MTPSIVTYDIGETVYEQKLTLTYSRDTGGAMEWTIRKDAANQRDDESVISGITDAPAHRAPGGWWLDPGWIISTGYRRENNGTEMLIFDPDLRRWQWYPHCATTMYEFEEFKTLTAALKRAA